MEGIDMGKLPEYTVYRTKRKSIRLVLRTNGTFAVYCPKRTPVYEIEEFFKKHANTLREKHNLKEDPLFEKVNGFDTLPYLGERRRILYSASAKSLSYENGTFIAHAGIDNTNLRSQYLEILRTAAKDYLPKLTKAYAEHYEFKYSSVRIKAMGSRFGSCSAKGNLNYSIALMACDEDFIRYVVLHELCHTVHMNHSAAFHTLLEKVCPNHKSVCERGKLQYSAFTRAVIYRPCP
jgi:predicted metal-dependent hydrolase